MTRLPNHTGLVFYASTIRVKAAICTNEEERWRGMLGLQVGIPWFRAITGQLCKSHIDTCACSHVYFPFLLCFTSASFPLRSFHTQAWVEGERLKLEAAIFLPPSLRFQRPSVADFSSVPGTGSELLCLTPALPLLGQLVKLAYIHSRGTGMCCKAVWVLNDPILTPQWDIWDDCRNHPVTWPWKRNRNVSEVGFCCK